MRARLTVALVGTAVLLLGGADRPAPRPLALCTDLGPLIGVEQPDGTLEGTLGARARPLAGTAEALTVQGWTTTLAALNPQDEAVPSPEAVATQFADRVRGWRARGRRVDGAGFEGQVGADGVLRGESAGRHFAFALGLDGRTVFGGEVPADAPLRSLPGGLLHVPATPVARPPRWLRQLAPTSTPSLPTFARIVDDNLREAGQLACPAPLDLRVFVGAWAEPLPLPEGHRVVYERADEVGIRDGDGAAAWLLELGGTPALGAGIRAGLQEAYPEHRVDVRHDPATDRLLVLVETGTELNLVGGEAVPDLEVAAFPAEALRPDPALRSPLAPRPTTDPRHAGGRELLARAEHWRAAAGLPALEPDPLLDWSASAHALYLDLHPGAQGHRQSASSRWFVGQRTGQRFGGVEVVHRQDTLPPGYAVDRWMETPFHRRALADPRAVRVGAASSRGGDAVLEIAIDPDHPGPERWTWPVDGQTEVPRRFSGLERPDPLPEDQHPHKQLPLGYTLSVFEARGLLAEAAVDTWIRPEGGEPLDHYVVSHLTHPHLARLRGSAVHLLPKRPFEPATRYAWGMTLVQGDHRRTVEASFTTEGPGLWQEVEPPEELAGFFARVVAAHGGPLVYDRGAEAFARLGPTASSVHARHPGVRRSFTGLPAEFLHKQSAVDRLAAWVAEKPWASRLGAARQPHGAWQFVVLSDPYEPGAFTRR